jgi:methylated-DNA-[protein]-cysteine S-methyltransferase
MLNGMFKCLKEGVTVFYDFFETGLIGTLMLAGDEAGLRHIEFENKPNNLAIHSDWKRNPACFAPLKAQLRAYFKGELEQFDICLAPVGTPFQLKVWQALRAIPYGRLVSYKSIAEDVGNPKAVRAVGSANAKNPIPIIVPCHRVIGNNGSLTGFGGGLDVKKRLIELERATFQFAGAAA